MTNFYVLTGLLLRGVSILLLISYVAPMQFRELRRPNRDNLVVYVRWTLLAAVLIFLSQQIVPISYQLTLLHTEGIFSQRNLATVTSNFGVLALACCLALLYKFSDMLAKRNSVD